MEKIIIGSNLPKNLLDLDNGVEKNIKILSEAKNKKISEIRACVMKRPRHDHIVQILQKLSVKIDFITDGDIAGALSVVGEKPKNDIYYSTGWSRGCLRAMPYLVLMSDTGTFSFKRREKIRAKKLGIKNFNKKYNIEDMIKGDVIFCATGVTDGDLVKGIKDLGNEFEVTTFALHKSKNINKTITNIFNK